MKNFITLILLFLASTAGLSQNKQYILKINLLSDTTISVDLDEYTKFDAFIDSEWNTVSGYTLIAISATAEAIVEAINHYYPKFKERFPNANDQWWNPKISWKNQYIGGDPANGYHWFRSTIGVVPSDAKHTFDSIRRLGIVYGSTLLAIDWDDKNWKRVGLEALGIYVVRGVVFTLVHDIYFGQKKYF